MMYNIPKTEIISLHTKPKMDLNIIIIIIIIYNIPKTEITNLQTKPKITKNGPRTIDQWIHGPKYL